MRGEAAAPSDTENSRTVVDGRAYIDWCNGLADLLGDRAVPGQCEGPAFMAAGGAQADDHEFTLFHDPVAENDGCGKLPLDRRNVEFGNCEGRRHMVLIWRNRTQWRAGP